MKAVVPAAGEGTRLRPLTTDRPKGLVEVAGDPLLAHVFELLRSLGVSEVVVVIGYEGDQIVQRFGQSYGAMNLEYVSQEEPLGLAHAIRQAAPLIDDHFVVLNGDNVFADDLESVGRPRYDGLLLVERGSPEDVARGGAVTIEDGFVREVTEKPDDPSTPFATTGCYALPPVAMDACEAIAPSDRGEYELADAINWLISRGCRFRAIEYTGWRCNVNTPGDIEVVEARLGDQASNPT